MMENRVLSYKNSLISYSIFGNGPKMAICFHGYGEKKASFEFLEKTAGKEFTFYAIDLPFHGNTDWKEGLNFNINDLVLIAKKIINQKDQKLTLIGFSLGGRVALSLYQEIPDEINKIVLLAPDGLKINFWYWLTTQTWIGSKLFFLTMKYPQWFFVFLRLLNQFKLVNASIFKFVNYYIGSKEIRDLLYKRWTSFRKLKPDLKKIKLFIRKNKTSVKLIYGKHDRIILPVRGEKFRKGIEDYCALSIMNSGHQVLHEKHSHEILSALLSETGID